MKNFMVDSTIIVEHLKGNASARHEGIKIISSEKELERVLKG